MALISLRQLLDHAAEHSYGVPAFNVNNLEQVRAIMEAAHESNSPVILQASAGARKYAGSNFLKHLIQAAIEEFPHVPIVMHQDHGVSPIAVGTSHGAYKFSRPPTGDTLAIERIKEIHRRIPNTHLVMHGSSSVPQEWLAIINQYGGQIGETYGVPVEEIQEGIRHGVRKVNIDTDLRLASTGAVRKFMAENPAEFDPRKFLAPTIKAMKSVVKARLEAFGTAGQIATIGKVYTLEEMADRYARKS